MRPVLRLAALVALAALAPAPGTAGVPIVSQCRFDSTLVLCPTGDVAYHGYVARFGPIPNAEVDIDIRSAPAVRILPGLDGSYFQSDNRTFALTNSLGLVAMFLRGGGVNAAEIEVRASGLTMRRLPVASFDQDGDLIVDATDEAIAAVKLGTTDRTADFDGDRVVTTADLAELRRHRGHALESPTRASAASWGRVKSLWR